MILTNIKVIPDKRLERYQEIQEENKAYNKRLSSKYNKLYGVFLVIFTVTALICSTVLINSNRSLDFTGEIGFSVVCTLFVFMFSLYIVLAIDIWYVRKKYKTIDEKLETSFQLIFSNIVFYNSELDIVVTDDGATIHLDIVDIWVEDSSLTNEVIIDLSDNTVVVTLPETRQSTD